MGFDFFYSYTLDLKRSSENVQKVLSYADNIGYSFFIEKSYVQHKLDILTATKLLITNESIDFYKNNDYAFEFSIGIDDKRLTFISLIHVDDYSECIDHIPRTMVILRPFKIAYFQMFEEYFGGVPFSTQEHNGPIIYGNLAQTWTLLQANIQHLGFKILDQLKCSEISSVKIDKNAHDYELTVYLTNAKTVVAAEITGANVCLMPEKPYVMYNYETGEDIDTAYYLDLYFKLAKDARVLDMVEAKNF